jgi:hypothetical protein
VEDVLPPYVSTYPIDHVYRHLEKYHGIATHVASNRLHRIKEENGLPADFDLLFDITGNVFRSDDRMYLGSLTAGGKTEGEG